MPVHFQRPENALKRAKEFIDVGKKQRALDALYDVIKSKKHRTWQKIHEPIMTEYLSLCVDLKKSHIAKEGLYQYKNICQQVNVKSLEDVVRAYLKLADDKTEAAREESKQAVIDVDDLEQMNTPEGLLLSAVSGEDTQDRTDRLLLTPWVKFLWESYRQCLELLRNNNRVERLYHDVAQQAFRFCLKYTRKTEFRKLCDNLRGHLNLINKHQHQQTSINLNNPESQQMHLETRLVQLDIAIQMELWQEAFKASEDIHGLIVISKKQPKPQLMANYYQKLAMIFFKSKNYLFHASAWHRLLQLSREQRKNLTADEQSRIATRVMLATLSVPISPPQMELHRLLELPDTSMDKKRRLANLLGLTAPPTRKQLVQDLVRQNIVHFASNDLKDLYKYMETDYHPLKMCGKIEKVLDTITNKSGSGSEELKLYVPLLQENTCVRLLKQLSQVYETISFDQLSALSTFATLHRLEKIAVVAARNKDLQVRIDHRNRAFYFGTDLTEAQREGYVEGPYLQNMPSEQIRNQLVLLFNALNDSVEMICPGTIQKKNTEVRELIFQAYRQSERREHEKLLQRKEVIEDRKIYLEELTREIERREHEKLEADQMRQREEEMRRLEREARERDEKRQEMEKKEIQMKTMKSRLEKLKETGIGDTILKDIDETELENMNVDDLLDIQLKQLNKEKKELEARLKSQEKKVDYFVRAVHLEELPLLQEQADKEMESNKTFWDEQEQCRIERLTQEREESLAHRDRLSRMQEDKEEFMKTLRDERLSVYEVKMVEFKKRLEAERKKRLAERKEQRKKDRKLQREKEKAEAEERAREAQAYREREERLRAEEEAEKQKQAELERRKAKLDEQMAKQQARDREIEEKQRQKEEAERMQREAEREGRDKPPLRDRDEGRSSWRAQEGPGRDGGPEPWRPGPKSDSGGWRQRELAREASWRGGADDSREERGWRQERADGERGPPRRFDEERGPPRRDDDREIRRDDDRRPPMRRDDDRGPPPIRRDDDRGPPPIRRDDDRGPPPIRRDDDRGPPPIRRDDDRGPPPIRRDDDRRPPLRRDDDRPPMRRDDDRGPPMRRDDDRGPPMRRDDDRGPVRRDDDRGPVRRDDDRGPPPRRDDDRGPMRRDDDRRPPMRRDDDRGPMRRDDDRPPMRRDDDRGPPPRRDDDRGPPRRDDDRGARGPQGPPRSFGDERGSFGRRDGGSRWGDDDRGPPRRGFDDDRGGFRRMGDDRGAPPSRFGDDRGPGGRGPPPPGRRLDDGPRRRFDDDRGDRPREGPSSARGDTDDNWRGGGGRPGGGGHPAREEVHKPSRHRSPSPDRNRDSRFDDEEEDGWTRVKH